MQFKFSKVQINKFLFSDALSGDILLSLKPMISLIIISHFFD